MHRLLHNKGAVAGIFSAVGIVSLGLLILLSPYVLRWRRVKQLNRHRGLGNAVEEAADIHGSNGEDAGPAALSGDVERRHRGPHGYWPHRGANDDGSGSRDGSDGYPPSSYSTSTLPEYAERSRSLSPPRYAELLGSQTHEVHSEARNEVRRTGDVLGVGRSGVGEKEALV
jgi:hypothetical protein